MNIYCDPTKRHDFVLLFDVKNGNPNGDPDAGNMPRIDPETMHGLVTDVCIKRKVRDYVAGVLEKPIFIQSETALNTLCREAKDRTGKPVLPAVTLELSKDEDLKALLAAEDGELVDWLKDLSYEGLEFDQDSNVITYSGDAIQKKAFVEEVSGGEDLPDLVKKAVPLLAAKLAKLSKGVKLTAGLRASLKDAMIDAYFDIRMFGAVLTAGTNAGQIRGPVQITFAQSIDPIQPRDIPITRVAITKPSDRLRKTTEMGRKAIVPYGLYRAHGFFNALLGRTRKGKSEWAQVVTESDLQDLWGALQKMFEFDRSAARGEMTVRGLYIFTHENEIGNAPAHKLFELIRTDPCGGSPRSFEDYKGRITAPKDGPLENHRDVTLTTLEGDGV
jgi:CRISPR-associated protein Csd2